MNLFCTHASLKILTVALLPMKYPGQVMLAFFALPVHKILSLNSRTYF